jgi:hypothetical protein
MTGIERSQLENKICLSAYKHRGDVDAVIKETGANKDYVLKTLKKLKKTIDTDVKFNLAYMIMGSVWTGFNQIEATMGEAFSKLQEEMYVELTVCCHWRTYVAVVEERTVIKCGKCDRLRTSEQLYLAPNMEIFAMMAKYDDQLRKHYECLIKYSEAMGFTAEKGPSTVIKQNVILVNDDKKLPAAPDCLSGDEVKAIEEMLPVERDMMIKRVESKVLEDGGGVKGDDSKPKR